MHPNLWRRSTEKPNQVPFDDALISAPVEKNARFTGPKKTVGKRKPDSINPVMKALLLRRERPGFQSLL